MYKHEIGICIDEAVAYLLEERNNEHLITIITAEETGSSEKKGRKDHLFYKKVFDIVQDFDKISLFATSKAKNEIIRRIRANKLNHIEVHDNAPEMVSETQKIDFINGYFEARA